MVYFGLGIEVRNLFIFLKFCEIVRLVLDIVVEVNKLDLKDCKELELEKMEKELCLFNDFSL